VRLELKVKVEDIKNEQDDTRAAGYKQDIWVGQSWTLA